MKRSSGYLVGWVIFGFNTAIAQTPNKTVDPLNVLKEKFHTYQNQLFRKCSPDGLPVLTDYPSDAKRTAEEALETGQGGMCGVHALVAATVLRDRLVNSVELCLTRPLVKAPAAP